ncbi:hypothetical protein ACWEQ8_17080 [Streptomyces noursei]|uniref:hypothetical protein n=1 Tax=Streptomyces noursei TaxID=1971 RepID=UPI001F3C542E|nr:hypothetical protein [Streptomyces noursei]MCE4947288.1 hypothetical protein [Streptomyces noursei]
MSHSYLGEADGSAEAFAQRLGYQERDRGPGRHAFIGPIADTRMDVTPRESTLSRKDVHLVSE